ncbi:4-hydroxybutyrate dehydrogenase [Natronincola ferrireducens]|uniref:4-hydroxybutyrate dehydrogenase n=1 Tax=Natronincola ferrireducens TaxID=393762 RepID=A0A1G8YAZ8_9FIRM|nr:4-hydroxybutyrate dehydrogenase [Natronincola ferrireducens]SDJ99843.1 4-hydroxybutyrate dehydrogenase [Natronincola ferrireducens]
MAVLKLQPILHKFNSFKEFAQEFDIGEEDCIFTNEFLYEPFMKEISLKADFLFQEKYGMGEPSDEMINALMAKISEKKYKRIIAVGGGTIIDISKILALKHVKNCIDLFEKKAPIVKDKKLIIVPTTCGTGSEVTNITIAEIKDKQTKIGLAADELYPEDAVLIPELVKSLPFKFFATSSVDALIHAIESYVAPKSNGYTELFSSKAIKLIIRGYKEIVEKGEDHRQELIEDFLVASNYAGIAFGNTGVGAVHALSYPLGGVYHVPHGEANYQFFIEVFKTYNRKNPCGKISKVNKMLAELLEIDQDADVYEALEGLLNKLLSKNQLKEYGMKEEEIEAFADSVIEKQQRLLANNYVPLSRDEIRDIYRALY